MLDIVTCEDRQKAAILVNSDEGAFLATSECFAGERHLLKVSETGLLMTAVTKSNEIGFAVGLSDSSFKAARFRLNGANEAIKHVMGHLKQADNYSL